MGMFGIYGSHEGQYQHSDGDWYPYPQSERHLHDYGADARQRRIADLQEQVLNKQLEQLNSETTK